MEKSTGVIQNVKAEQRGVAPNPGEWEGASETGNPSVACSGKGGPSLVNKF